MCDIGEREFAYLRSVCFSIFGGIIRKGDVFGKPFGVVRRRTFSFHCETVESLLNPLVPLQRQ